jgi:Flp pilus assembly pilin Flp
MAHMTRAVPMADDGQGLAEYAVILALIAIFVVLVLLVLGDQSSVVFHGVGKSV